MYSAHQPVSTALNGMQNDFGAGTINPAALDSAGNVFSSQTFLLHRPSNWSLLHHIHQQILATAVFLCRNTPSPVGMDDANQPRVTTGLSAANIPSSGAMSRGVKRSRSPESYGGDYMGGDDGGRLDHPTRLQTPIMKMGVARLESFC